MIACPNCTAEQPVTCKFCSECGVALRAEYDDTVAHAGLVSPPESSVSSSLSDSSQHGRFLPGTRVAERYRIVSLVGKGGMGEVYRADDLKLGHTVALKFLPTDLANDAQRLEFFHNEVRLSRQISHPNVCRVYDIGDVDGQHFLSMEYIDGEDLKILLRRIGRLPRDKGVEIAQQLCAGLAAAHDKGVLHRDLKPANIMIDGRGQVRITDFGLARLTDETVGGEVAGTPAYMAPEQLSRGEATIQSDLFSLGLILYELFTGKVAYSSSSIPELKQSHANSTPSQPSSLVEDIDPAVERVILRCLEREPSRRPTSAAAVAAALPGGDPLAAALAAGETPSPEMVAASGESGGLSLAVGSGLLAVIIVMIVASTILSDYVKPYNLAAWNGQKPALLEATAKAMIGPEGFDYESAAIDSTHGFERGYENNVEFWYRQSTQALHPHPPNLMALSWLWEVTSSNPARQAPGMVSVKLAPDGALREFLAVPPEQSGVQDLSAIKAADEIAQDSQVILAFDFAKLNFKDFEIVTGDTTVPYWPPPVYADSANLWNDRSESTEKSAKVVTATRENRLVYFRVIRPGEIERTVIDRIATSGRFDVRGNLFLIIVVSFSVPLALRNVRLGRGDLKGALRLTIYFLAIELLLWLPAVHHSTNVPNEIRRTTDYLIYSIAYSFRIWLYYIALEPYVRRLWPSALISSSRVLSGMVRDPLVGRDLLIGSALGVANGIVTLLSGHTATTYFAYPLIGGRHAIASVFILHQNAIMGGVVMMVFLLLFRVTLRRPWLVLFAFAIANMLLFTPIDAGISVWAYFALFSVMSAFLVTRFGLVAFFGYQFSVSLFQYVPISSDVSQWYAGTGLIALGALLLIACFGYYTSTIAGRDWNWDPLSA